jgi:hypothetical protein
MRIVVIGSIALDHLIAFQDHFNEQLVSCHPTICPSLSWWIG